MKNDARTPLQEIIGFELAEELYDELEFEEQIILDMIMAGWSHADIGVLMGCTQSWITVRFKAIRYKVANSALLQRRLSVEKAEQLIKNLADEVPSGNQKDIAA